MQDETYRVLTEWRDDKLRVLKEIDELNARRLRRLSELEIDPTPGDARATPRALESNDRPRLDDVHARRTCARCSRTPGSRETFDGTTFEVVMRDGRKVCDVCCFGFAECAIRSRTLEERASASRLRPRAIAKEDDRDVSSGRETNALKKAVVKAAVAARAEREEVEPREGTTSAKALALVDGEKGHSGRSPAPQVARGRENRCCKCLAKSGTVTHSRQFGVLTRTIADGSKYCDACIRYKEARKMQQGTKSPQVNKKQTVGQQKTMKRTLDKFELQDLHASMSAATEAGDIERLNRVKAAWLALAAETSNLYAWDHELISSVARDGRRPIEVIEWALENGARYNVDVAKRAVERTPHREREFEGEYVSALTVLQYIHKRMPKTINEDVLYCATEFGELECVQYMVENVAGLDVAKWPEWYTPRGKSNTLCQVAAQNGHLDVFKYLYSHDCDFSIDDARECVALIMNQPLNKRPLRWYETVLYIQTTDEWNE